MMAEFWRLGLIGWPLEHSYSPRLHQAALKAAGLQGEYRLLPAPALPEGAVPLEGALEALRRGELQGLNVTLPHKRAVMAYLDGLTQTAQAVGAANTIHCTGGRLFGDNTDVPGFLADLGVLGLENPGLAVIIGAGGAARAGAYALLSIGWEVVLASRRLEGARSAAEALARSLPARSRRGGPPPPVRGVAADPAGLEAISGNCSLLVNATPVGMYPDSGSSPWPSELALPASAAVYDMVYNPQQTKLVRDALAAGLPARGGIGMLVEQAAFSFEAWTGVTPSREAMLAAVTAP